MPEIVDILTPDSNELSSFVVNTAVNFVNVTNFGAAVLHASDLNTSKFERGDSFIILSCGFFIPENFVVWDYPGGVQPFSAPLLLLQGTKGGGTEPIKSFGNYGEIKLPFPKYEFSIGTFNDPEYLGLTDPTFELVCYFPRQLNSLQISMVNVPAAINGLTFKVTPFIKVLHNFPLTI